jgi:UDP-N-acetylmuramoyl-tripeptide--D-alanyl-D-alanine ligase
VTAGFRADQAVAWTGGTLRHGAPDCRFSGVSIDSRSVGEGQLFVAIRGPRHDGHDHLQDALAAGARGALVAEGTPLPPPLPEGAVVIDAADTTRALGALARGHRDLHRGPVVAITGSNGKTTTKEMCAAILASRGPCLKTEGNLNNEFGLPLTLLRRDDRDQALVVELGMNHRGEIARLTAIARPTVGVLTNVGTAHIEFLGSREEIAREKGDLAAHLGAEDVAVFNADDPLAWAQRERTTARVVGFGRGPAAAIRAQDVAWRDGAFHFTLVAPSGRTAVEVAGLDETAVSNALAAAAGALVAGASLEDVAAGLRRYRPVPGRLQPRRLAGGVLLIDDSYNANPQSMEVALRALTRDGMRDAGRRIAVLGDMGELGDEAPAAHHRTGALAASLGVELLFALGSHAVGVAEGARSAGLREDQVHVGEDPARLAEAVAKAIAPGDRVLVKGSRSMRMERVVEQIEAAVGGAP